LREVGDLGDRHVRDGTGGGARYCVR
jgi:hypothetical protein